MSALSITVGADISGIRTNLALAQDSVKSFNAETRNLARQMNAAADDAKGQFLPALQASTKGAADAQARAATYTAELKRNAEAANENAQSHGHVASAMGSSRSAFMEIEHSARASADALAAGADPLRVLAMEAPRVAQALTQLGPGAMAAIVSPAGAAVAAVAALAAGLAYLAINSAEAENALNAAKAAMAFSGTLGAPGIKSYTADVQALISRFGEGKTEAEQTAGALAGLKGPASEYHDQILNIAAGYAQLKGIKLTEAIAEVIKAANGGSDSFLKWADEVGVVTQAQKDLVAGAGHDQLKAFGVTVDAISGSWGNLGLKEKEAKTQLEGWNSVMMAAGLAGAPILPSDFGIKGKPTAEELSPTQGPQGPTAAEAQGARTASAYNEVLIRRQGILRDIDILQGLINADTDPVKLQAHQAALDTAKAEAARLHTVAEQQGFERDMGHLKQVAAAAEQGSAQRIAALRQEADLAGKYYGQNSSQFQDAQTQIAEAVRESQTKARQEYETTLSTLERVTQSARQFSLTLHNDMEQLTADLARGNDRIDRTMQEFTRSMDAGARRVAKDQQEVADMASKTWNQAFHSIQGNFNSSIAGMIAGTQTFRQAEQAILQNIVATFAEAALKSAEDWVVGQFRQVAATQAAEQLKVAAKVSGTAEGAAVSAAAGSKSVVHDAYEGAAGAYKAVVGIPLVGPILAPIAAGVAFAGIMAFDTFSAAGGMGYVPYDGAIIKAHEAEMVLPRDIATPLRDRIADGSLGDGSGGQHTHIHVEAGAVQVVANGRLSAQDIHDFEDAMTDALGRATARAARNHAFVGMRMR